MGLGRKTTKVKCRFHHIIPRVHNINMSNRCWCWPWPPGWGVFVRILHSEVTNVSLFHTVLFGRKLLYTGYTRNEEWDSISMKAEYLHQLFGIILYRRFCLFSPIYLFMQSCIYLVWTHGYLFHTLGKDAIQLCFVAQRVVALATGGSWLLCFEHFLTSLHYRMLQTHLVYFLTQFPGLVSFIREWC